MTQTHDGNVHNNSMGLHAAVVCTALFSTHALTYNVFLFFSSPCTFWVPFLGWQIAISCKPKVRFKPSTWDTLVAGYVRCVLTHGSDE